jgi:hypothetical protein
MHTATLLESRIGPRVASEPAGASGPHRIFKIAFDTTEEHQ